MASNKHETSNSRFRLAVNVTSLPFHDQGSSDISIPRCTGTRLFLFTFSEKVHIRFGKQLSLGMAGVSF